MISGENPYSPDLAMELRNSTGNVFPFPEEVISMMLYPPWSIPFFLPFGFLNFPLMRLLWFIFHIALLVICTNRLWKIYSGPINKKYFVFVILITFAPTYFLLVNGHITTMHLLGLIGFLYFIENPSIRNQLASGASASLVLIKPQLLYLFLFALIIWIIFNRRWMVLFGGACMILMLSLISIVINPIIYFQFWDTFSNYDFGTWATPTIGMLGRFIFGLEYEWLQILPIFLGLVWFISYWYRRRRKWDWLAELPLLLLVCVVTSPYGWTYDMVVLLIPVIAITIDLTKIRFNWIIGIYFFTYILINLLTLYLHSFLNDFWFFWYAPFLLIWYLIGKKIVSRENIPSPEALELDSQTLH